MMLQGRKLKQYIYLILASVVFIAMVAGILVNTLQFDEEMDKVYKQFVSDNNEQLAQSISDSLITNKNIVNEFAKCLERFDVADYAECDLKGKANSIGLDDIYVLSVEDPYLDMLTDDSGYLNDAKIYTKTNDKIVYIAPIVRDDTVNEVLVGVEELDTFYPIINQKDNYQYGILALIDNNTKKVIVLEKGENSTFTQEEINQIINDEEVVNSKIQYNRRYITSTTEVPMLNWTQLTAENNRSFLMMVGSYVERFLALVLIEVIVFSILILAEKKDIEKKKETYFIDYITGGYNRQGFISKASKCIGFNYNSYAIVVLDICEFRKINNEWGEEIGDKLLKFIDNKIVKHIDNKEVACRLSMDYFAILLNLKEGSVEDRVTNIIEDINKDIEDCYGGEKIEFLIGVCELAKEKDIAQAIGNGIFVTKNIKKRNTCLYYDEELAKKRDQEIELVNRFDEALKRHEFKVYLQPKLSKSGECRAEALVRWQHPKKGMLKPNTFINVFEKYGKIYELDKYIFEEVCTIIAEWKALGKEDIEISVNLSRQSLKDSHDEIWKVYRDIKNKYKIADDIIEIEITETSSIDVEEVEFIKKAIKGFKLCGLKVSLDDFGVAYSSLYVLKEFDVDTIKLDRSFFVEETTKSRTIVDYTIRLAHTLGIMVVAEGIEEIQQVEVLWTCGCDYIQGYVYSKPLPVKEFEAWRKNYEK